jgi:signal transduction histidine kinase
MVLRLSVAASLIALLVLAGLQYQWIGQIEQAERQRMERGVAESAEEFAEDFSNEVRGLLMMFELRPAFSPDPDAIAMRYREWTATATYPNLLKNLYLTQPPSGVLRLDRAKGVFEPAAWPAHLVRIPELISWQNGPPVDLDAGVDVLLIPAERRMGGPMRGRGFRGPGPPGLPPGPPREGPPRGGPPPREPGDERWIVAELNHEVITTQILPALVDRRFPDYENQDYRVAVVARRPSGDRRTVFTSGEAWPDADLKTPDFQLDLLGPPPRRPPGAGGISPGLPGPPPGDRGGERGFRGGGERRGPFSTFAGQGWQLLVKHRAGSVELAARQFRFRNLAISFGILVVLGIGAVAMVVSGSRARRLGKLQMEFAAGVSHELRTPLAVIQSAAHNLRTGIVQNREDIEEYAAIVQTETRRLTEMVEQVMTYTETQSGRRRYDLAPVDIGNVADKAIQNMSSVLREGSATVEKRFEPGLPPVMADAPALTRSLQNLLSNAVKYGRSHYSAQIALEGRFVAVPGSPGNVELSVIDQGLGVPEADVSHLFEAFYRGSNAGTNTPGNGLGLHLVHRIMEAQKGTVTYARTDSGGARFTLTLPAASKPA